ncbi:putative secreted protein (Por secretion system target) [Flavobacterium sp. 103]|uniref:T9SS type A sorting domain-containing protein n=1 Tax=Flavobacterium sp. 103 TaxID=2135624 RepID=UPI000D5FA3DA|nr:T9SS type A sorting domain-containing protein [Flavobacterium sp. 103]PVX44641.1 putative secreted protein (Por secretion system target) [Flavobacterium sp. 103]
MTKKLLSALLFLIVVLNSNSQTVYVKKDATGLNNGTSWQNAYTDLSTAINSTNSGQIWVAQGTYFPTTDLNGQIPIDAKLNTFKLKLNIAIYGGFSGIETNLNQRNWTNYPTILSGNIGDENLYTDNVIHVFSCEYVNLNSTTILDGLTIKGGYAKLANGFGNEKGGGIYVNQTSSGSFIVKNCILEENYAIGYGGGLYVFNSNPIIENCIFRNNKAFQGGGMYLEYTKAIINNCHIDNNIADNFPTSGYSSLRGGGICIGSYSSPTISNNSITNNFAKNEGGAFVNDSNYEVLFTNNIVSGNKSGDGGALFLGWTTYCFNNLFFNNQATRYGGAIYMDYDPNRSQFINNTVVQNSAASQGGGLYITGANPDVTNSLFYSNTSPIGPQIKTINGNGNWSPDFRYCDIQGGLTNLVTSGNVIVYQDNIDVNPLFTDAANNNFHLQSTSTLINAGTTNLAIITATWPRANGGVINFPNTDLDGYQRILNTIDIGAYEFDNSLGIIDATEKISFSIYPNPANGVFNFSSDTNYDLLSVYDIQGRELFHQFNESGMTSINLANYPSGLYFVRFFINNKKYTYKIINK